MIKPRCMITVDVEAMPMRAGSKHVDTLIYGKIGGGEYGIGKIMDIADKHHVKITFFLILRNVNYTVMKLLMQENILFPADMTFRSTATMICLRMLWERNRGARMKTIIHGIKMTITPKL